MNGLQFYAITNPGLYAVEDYSIIGSDDWDTEGQRGSMSEFQHKLTGRADWRNFFIYKMIFACH